LGDAFNVKLNGEGVDLTGEIYDNTSDGTLKGYEIDPEAAVSEFKGEESRNFFICAKGFFRCAILTLIFACRRTHQQPLGAGLDGRR
jgi:hypothetical protein